MTTDNDATQPIERRPMQVFVCYGRRGNAKKEQKLGAFPNETAEGAIRWAQDWYDEEYDRHPEKGYMIVTRASNTKDGGR